MSKYPKIMPAEQNQNWIIKMKESHYIQQPCYVTIEMVYFELRADLMNPDM